MTAEAVHALLVIVAPVAVVLFIIVADQLWIRRDKR